MNKKLILLIVGILLLGGFTIWYDKIFHHAAHYYIENDFYEHI